jgi:hypothetical protein
MTNIETTAGSKGQVGAVAFIQKGGEELNNLFKGICEAKAVERTGALSVMLYLETHHAELVPVPGSKQGETGNKPFDKYTATVKTSDGEKKIPGSWFTDATRSVPYVQWADEQIEYCNDATLEGCPEKISNMGAGERADYKKLMKDVYKDTRASLVKGAMLLNHAEKIAAINPARIKIKMPFRKAADTGKLSVYSSNIRLIDPEGEFEDKVFSVSSFLGLNPAKLVGKPEDQTIVSLEKTGERAAKGAGKNKKKGGEQAITVPRTIGEVLTFFNCLSTALDNGTDEGRKMESQLLAACAASGEKGEAAVLYVGTVCMAMDNIWTVINKRFDEINAKKIAAGGVAKTGT